jgi:hypothetical protein
VSGIINSTAGQSVPQVYVPGYDKGIFWAPDTGGGPIPVDIVGWDIDDAGDLVDVSSTGTGGQQAFLACLQRTGVTVNANFNASQVPSTGLGIRFGAKGTISVLTGSPSQPWSVHVSIASVKHKSAVNGAVSYTFEAKSDALTAAGSFVPSINYPS